ncbi:MAG TPA: bile acid:sodium symporter [Candidatus Limnocylindrales bacterium]|nr:bile acid:sodium symporter [Candidatus Limnocylindrales bacterium]
MLTEVTEVVAQVAMLVFVVGSMAAMGLGLTLSRIAEPLRDLRLVVALLVVNFVVVPAAAIAAARLLPLEPDAATAVVLIGCVAGAPFLPKLAQLSKSNIPLAVAGMVLLMVTTIGYAPIVVPLAVPGATVDPLEIAQSLVLFMLIPLGVGLLVRANYPVLADDWAGKAGQASSMGLMLGISSALLLSWRQVIGSFGTWIFVGLAIIFVVALVSGWLAGMGRPAGDRMLLGLATANRNIAAGLVIAASIGGDTLVYTLVGALTLPVMLIAIARRIGKNAVAAPAAVAQPLPDPAV